MVDEYEYEAGTLNDIWENFSIKEDTANDRLVFQRQGASKTELLDIGAGGSFNPSEINEIVYVADHDDLPAASNGTHTLEDNTAYYFTQFVSHDDSIELGNTTPIIGAHGGVSGYIYTGGGDAIVGTDKGVFMRNVYIHAPGGTIFNVSGDTSTEVLIEMCAFSDAAGLGNIASLGTFDGFRVPSFKGCNFEDFNDGLTFTGTSDKIFISESPFRGVTESGVTILHFDSNIDTDIVDITDSYIKGVQSDTVVVDVDPAGTISEVFQYRGVTHDQSVTKSNVLTGDAGQDVVGYRVADSFPIADSGIHGELSLDADTTYTINTAGTFEIMDDGATTLGPDTERFSQQSNGVVEYVGQKDTHVHAMSNVTVDTTGDTVAIAISKNGTVQPESEMRVTGSNATQSFISSGSMVSITNGDTIETQITNIDSNTDLPVSAYTMNLVGTN